MERKVILTITEDIERRTLEFETEFDPPIQADDNTPCLLGGALTRIMHAISEMAKEASDEY